MPSAGSGPLHFTWYSMAVEMVGVAGLGQLISTSGGAPAVTSMRNDASALRSAQFVPAPWSQVLVAPYLVLFIATLNSKIE